MTNVSGFWRGAGVGLVGARALMQPSQGSRVAPVEVRRVRGGSVDGGGLLGSVGVMVAVGSDLFLVLSFRCVWSVAVGVRSGWVPPSRRQRKGGAGGGGDVLR